MSELVAAPVATAAARAADRRCATCAFFRGDPHEIEAAIPGLGSLGSGFAAVRADDGLCVRHDRYLSARAHCAQYMPRVLAASA